MEALHLEAVPGMNSAAHIRGRTIDGILSGDRNPTTRQSRCLGTCEQINMGRGHFILELGYCHTFILLLYTKIPEQIIMIVLGWLHYFLIRHICTRSIFCKILPSAKKNDTIIVQVTTHIHIFLKPHVVMPIF